MMSSTAVQFSVGSYRCKGGRRYSEDRFVVVKDFNKLIPDTCNNKRRSFFAIYDGHCGSKISDFLASAFHNELARNPKILLDPVQALEDCWVRMEERCYALCSAEWDSSKSTFDTAQFPRSGSTATVCLLVDDDAYVTNCGDSAAFSFSRDGRHVCMLTEEHGTDNAEEVARCVAQGGTLTPIVLSRRVRGPFHLFPWCCNPLPKTVIKRRLYPGGLLVTRAFGDFHAKLSFLGGNDKVVTAEHGTIKKISLDSGGFGGDGIENGNGNVDGDGPFVATLVLASDGVWDALSPSEVHKIIATHTHTAHIPRRSRAHFGFSSHPREKSTDGDHEGPQKQGMQWSTLRTTSTSDTTRSTISTVTNPSSTTTSSDSSVASMFGDEVVAKEVRDGSGADDDDFDAEDMALDVVAHRVCEAAGVAPYWSEMGTSADNASCIIIRFRPLDLEPLSPPSHLPSSLSRPLSTSGAGNDTGM